MTCTGIELLDVRWYATEKGGFGWAMSQSSVRIVGKRILWVPEHLFLGAVSTERYSIYAVCIVSDSDDLTSLHL